MSDPDPVGGEIRPRDHGDSTPVPLSPSALLCPYAYCDWDYEVRTRIDRAAAPIALWAHGRVAHHGRTPAGSPMGDDSTGSETKGPQA